MNSQLPELHGPFQDDLSFRWTQVNGEWVYDYSGFVPQTYPAPVPDYAPDELERIEAAEQKRARKIRA